MWMLQHWRRNNRAYITRMLQGMDKGGISGREDMWNGADEEINKE